MRLVRTIAAVCAAVLVTLTLTASPVAAGGQGEPIVADLNGDGRPDTARLGVTGDRCAVTVRWGGTNSTEVFPYVPPGGVPLGLECPDLGVAVDVGGNGSVELVVGWFGSPDVPEHLVLLRNFVPEPLSGGFDFISRIETADLNGDGLMDVYLWNDQGDGFASLLNNRNNRLTPGPLRFTNGEVDQYELVDLDANGRLDVVIGFSTGSGNNPDCGVVVVFDTGRQNLLRGSDCSPSWRFSVVWADEDILPDIRTVSDEGEVVTTLNRTSRRFADSPIVRNDTATVRPGVPQLIRFLDNDQFSESATVTIVTGPRYGRLLDDSVRKLVYLRTAPGATSDTVTYQITDGSRTATGRVIIRVQS
jgi:hypothetical protein